jgi:hypothetical protein
MTRYGIIQDELNMSTENINLTLKSIQSHVSLVGLWLGKHDSLLDAKVAEWKSQGITLLNKYHSIRDAQPYALQALPYNLVMIFRLGFGQNAELASAVDGFTN